MTCHFGVYGINPINSCGFEILTIWRGGMGNLKRRLLKRKILGEKDVTGSCVNSTKYWMLWQLKKTHLQWLGHTMRMGEDGMPKKIPLEEPEGCRKVGSPRLSWLVDVSDDLARAVVRNWRRRTQERELWRKIIEEAKAHLGLLSC
jgi:hypothetical protein